jgi:hypothetical protein
VNSDLIIVISREHELYAIDVNILRVIAAYLDDSLIVFSLFTLVATAALASVPVATMTINNPGRNQ